MQIKRYKNHFTSLYDIELINEDKHLLFLFGGTLDLYISISNKKNIPYNQDYSMSFDITKEDYEIFSIFDELYRQITTGYIYDEDDFNEQFSESNLNEAYDRGLITNDGQIEWISDDGLREAEDKFTIIPIDEDTYRLTFFRNSVPLNIGFKNSFSISVRIRNSGSYYGPFHIAFMKVYNKLQEIDPIYHQIHFEEIEYIRKRRKNGI